MEHKCQEEPFWTTVGSGFAPCPGLWFWCRFWCQCSLLSSATLRVAGSLQKSTEVMQAMQSLVHVPEVAATMRDLSREMMRVSHNIAPAGLWYPQFWFDSYIFVISESCWGHCKGHGFHAVVVACFVWKARHLISQSVLSICRHACVCLYLLIAIHQINWFWFLWNLLSCQLKVIICHLFYVFTISNINMMALWTSKVRVALNFLFFGSDWY
jgi:hypothetical protein